LGFESSYKKKAILKYRYRRNEIVEAARKRGVPVEYVVFDNEGHGFTKKANEIRANKAILDFLDKHLRGK
jgi:dipeptidyl aminopeptidase/acylaminoacyl peptidase